MRLSDVSIRCVLNELENSIVEDLTKILINNLYGSIKNVPKIDDSGIMVVLGGIPFLQVLRAMTAVTNYDEKKYSKVITLGRKRMAKGQFTRRNSNKANYYCK